MHLYMSLLLVGINGNKMAAAIPGRVTR